MAGIQYVAPLQFTGANASTLPQIVTDLVVAGATRRFVAKSVNQAIGTTVPSWSDIAGSGTAIVPVSSTAPTLSTVGGIRSVLFNGTSDGLQQSVSMNQGHSLVLVANIVTPNTTGTTTLSGSYVTAGVDAARIQTSLTAMYANAGTAMTIAGQNVTGWRVIVASFNGASTVVNINGTEYTGNAGTLPRAVFTLGFERGSLFANVAVAEAALYPTALGSSDRAALVNQLRSIYAI